MNLKNLKLFDWWPRFSTSIQENFTCSALQNHKISLPAEYAAQNNVLIKLFRKEAAVVKFDISELLKLHAAYDHMKKSFNNLTKQTKHLGGTV